MGTPAQGPWAKYAQQDTQEHGPWEKYAQPTETTPAPVASQPQTMLQKIGQGAEEVGSRALQTFASPVLHPIDTLTGIAKQIGTSPYDERNPINQRVHEFVAEPNRAKAWEDVGGDVLGMAAQGGVLKGAGELPRMGSAIRDAAIGNPDVSALKGLRVGPSSPKSLQTLDAVQGARPFLQGAKNLKDLQTRIPEAKSEIWAPYEQAIQKSGDMQVRGPDGPTTIRDLENERLQTSALLRGLRTRSPEAIQLAQQKGMGEADLLNRDAAIKSALDPQLEKIGVNPQDIRKAFGQVSQVNSRVSGKSTLAEESQPYGFGRVKNLDLAKPQMLFTEGGAALRDLAAGNPWWSGKPTDVNIRQAFRSAGPKPNFGTPVTPERPNPLLLPSEVPGNAPYGEDFSHGGFPQRSPTITPAPIERLRLPAMAGAGEPEPMIGIRNTPYPALAEDYARTRIEPTRFNGPPENPFRLPRGLLDQPKKAAPKTLRKSSQ